MSVRAKFYVQKIEHIHQTQPGSVVANVTLAPVFGTFGDGKDNESWSKYTPSGKIEMTITNPGAIEQFEIGKAYLLTFDPVD